MPPARSAAPPSPDVAGSDPSDDCNEVRLVGRLAAAPVERGLPSGDAVAQFRVVVQRTGRGARPGVDTIDCADWTVALRRRLLRWAAGDVVEVAGPLRRRFWRSPDGGAASRYEVEVHRVRRVRRATMAG